MCVFHSFFEISFKEAGLIQIKTDIVVMCKVCEWRTNIKSIKQYVECNNMLSKSRSTEYVQLEREHIQTWMFKNTFIKKFNTYM
jgi:hypothetical protein